MSTDNSWYCFKCLSESLPFIHITDTDEFHEIISDLYDKRMNVLHLNDTIFDPFDFNDDNLDSAYNEFDPDLNFFNDINIASLSCDYFREDSFVDRCNQLPITKDTFSIIHSNIRSAKKNIDNFDNYISNLKCSFSIIALTETWLCDDNIDLYSIKGYKSVNSTRLGKRGGGVSLHIRDDILFTSRDDLSVNNDIIESSFIEISKSELCNEHDIILGVIYRPPNTNVNAFNDIMSGILSTLKQSKCKYYLAGDYNINLLNSDEHAPTSEFIDLMYSYAMFPLIRKPTRIHGNTATLIDNIFHNISFDSLFFNGILVSDISDHYPVFHIDYGTKFRNKEEFIFKRDFSNHHTELFIKELTEFNWCEVSGCTDAQIAFTTFHSAVGRTINVFH